MQASIFILKLIALLNIISQSRLFSWFFGFVFAFFPSLLSFLVTFLIRRKTFIWDKKDYFFLLGILLLTIPTLFTSTFSIKNLLEFILYWCMYKTFHGHSLNKTLTNYAIWGYFLGLVTTALIVWWQILNKQEPRALGLAGDPNLFAHSTLIIGSASLLFPRFWMKCSGMLLALLIISQSGSRAALIGWILLTMLFVIFTLKMSQRTRVGLVIAIACITTFIAFTLNRFNTNFLVSDTSPNLFRATEFPSSNLWNKSGISVNTQRVKLKEKLFNGYSLTKIKPESWQRLQQAILIEPNQTYTLSVWIEINDLNTQPGLLGWGKTAGAIWQIQGYLAKGKWIVSSQGSGKIISSGMIPDEIGQRVWITFMYQGSEPVIWNVGPAPDQREKSETSATFWGLQLEISEHPSYYQAGKLDSGKGTTQARLMYWQASMKGITENPIFGFGLNSFSNYYKYYIQQHNLSSEIPYHTHNFFLQTIFERGLLGFVGLCFFLIAIFMNIQRSLILITITALFINLFDNTFFYGGLIYPLFALLTLQHPSSNLSRS